jgi:hypothetical protein
VLQPDNTILLSGTGNANQPLLVEATTDLSTGLWETIEVVMPGLDGVFSLIDQDAPLMPMRFYRVAQ